MENQLFHSPAVAGRKNLFIRETPFLRSATRREAKIVSRTCLPFLGPCEGRQVPRPLGRNLVPGLALGFIPVIAGIAFCLTFLITPNAQAQDPETDSLKKIVEMLPADTIQLRLYKEISMYCSDAEIVHYVSSVVTLADKLVLKYRSGPVYRTIILNKLKAISMLGYRLQDLGKTDTAFILYKQSLELAESIQDKKESGIALINMGTLYQNKGEMEKAVSYNEMAIALQKEIHDFDNLAVSYNNLGNIFGKQGDLDTALYYHLEGIRNRILAGDSIGLAYSYQNISGVYFYKGDYNSAIEYLEKGRMMLENQGDIKALSNLLNNLGAICKEQGNIQKALFYYYESVKICESKGYKLGMTAPLNNIATVYELQDDFKKGIEYHLKSLAIRLDINDQEGIASSLVNIGSNYVKQNKPDSALNYFHQGLVIGRKMGLKSVISRSLQSIGTLYALQNNRDSALLCFLEAYKISMEIGDKYGQSALLNKMSLHDKNGGKLQAALDKSVSSLNLANELGNIELIRNAAETQSDILLAMGRYKESLDKFKLYVLMKDSLVNKLNKREVVRKEFEYGALKKDNEIVILKKDQLLKVAEIERQRTIKYAVITGGFGILLFSMISFVLYKRRRDVLQQKNEAVFNQQVSEVEMKALRSQMNPHFIFNALQSVNDFIQKKDIGNASRFLVRFAKLMRLVLENSVHKEVSLEKDLASLELYMQLESSRLDFPFNYEIVVDEHIDPEATLVPPLILQPFVENAIWHGLKHKRENGKIKIVIKEENDLIICCIEDNGVGREQAMLLKEPMPEKKESLGMKLTKERLRILEKVKKFKSRIEVIDLKDSMNNSLGVRVELSLPLSTY